MSRIYDAFRWEYGVQRRHILLILAAGTGGADLYIANLTGSVPALLALAALCSPLLGGLAVLQASLDEQITLAAWSLIGWLGLGITTVGLHNALASNLTLTQFQHAHPIGLAIMTAVSVIMVLFVVSVLVATANAVWIRTTGGDGGASPEERVLSEEAYADFEPILDDTLPAIIPQFAQTP